MQGRTPLHSAAETDALEVAQHLIADGANIAAKDDKVGVSGTQIDWIICLLIE